MTTPNIRELRRQRAQRHARGPVFLKLLFVLGGLYVLYVLAGFFLAPSLLKSQIERRASEQLKREVHVEQVAFNPFTLSLRIEKLLVRDHDGQPLVGWRQLFFNFEIFDLISNQIHFSEIELDGFASRIFVSKEGVLNISDILASATPSSKSGKPWSLRIDRLAVNRAELDYSDASKAEPFATHLGPTTFVLREFRTTGGPGAPGVFTATTEAGETIQWTGRVALAPLRSNGDFRIGQLALKKYAPFYAPQVNFDVLNGTIDVQVPYEFTIENNKPQLKITEGAAQLHNLQIAERGKTDPVVSLTSLDAAHASLDLQASTAELRQVSLTGGRLVVRREAAGINLMSLLPPAAPDAGKTGSAPAASAWRAQVTELTGKDFAISFVDKTTPKPGTLDLSRLSFSVKRFSTADLAAALPVEFRAEIAPGGGTAHGEGQAALKPLKAELNLALEGGSAAAFSPWIETFADVVVTQGLVGIRTQVRANEASDGSIVIAATSDADIGSFVVTDARGDALASWKSLSVKGAEFSSKPARLTVTDVSIADPEMQLVMRKDHVLNVSTLMRQKAAPPPTVSLGAPAPPSQFIAVDRIALANAKIRYVDQSIEPNVQTSVDQLSGTITGLTSAAIDRADLDLNGRVGGTAPLSIKGKINVLSEQLAADVRLDLRDSDLAPVGPYVAKFVGYKLASGAVSVDSKAKVNDRKLDSTTNVVITNFALGEATNSPDAPHVPVHLALALLRDRDGKITLPLPVQGSLDDPNFQIGGVVMKIVVSLVTKAATSPFSLIGAMFGGGKSGEDLAYQDFPVGVSQLDARGMQKLDVVAKALQERPALRLAIIGRADPTTDLPALRDQELERRIRVAAWEISRKSDPTLDSPEKVAMSRDDADKALAFLYRDVFMQPAPDPAPAAASTKPAEEPRRGFFLFRWFTRSKPQPAPAVAKKAPNATAAQPTGPATVRPGGPVIASEYGKVIGSEYGTVIGATTPGGLPRPDEMRRRLLEAIPAGDNELRKLAVDRAEQIRAYLTTRGGVAPDRVDVSGSELPAKGGTRVALDLR